MRDLALTLLVYAALALACFGWGVAAARALRVTSDPVTLTWLGWAVVLLIFQIVHLAVPLNAFATAPVFLIGIALSLRRLTVPPKGLALVVLVAAVWIALRSMLTPTIYDTGLYHLATIRWINTFPVVPGLGNLHGRLAFNQTFFTYAASLNVVANGSRMANGFLLLLAMTTFLARLRPRSHPFDYLPSLFALPIVIHLALLSPTVASPTPDLASTLLQLVMFVMLARVLRGADERAILIVLAATAITIKLSNLAFSIVVIAICMRRGAHRVVALAAVVIVVWIARGYISSGAPLYPSTLGYIAFDWSVPRSEVAFMATQIRGFARLPSAEWMTAIHNWSWLSAWSRRLEKTAVLAPLLLGTCFLIAARKRGKELVILLPILAGLAFWFFSAPDPRFAHALFFCDAIAGALLFLRNRGPLAIVIVFALTNLGLFVQMIRDPSAVSVDGWQPIPTVPLKQKGFVFVPAIGEQCWDARLPCTPYFRDDLIRRGSGFAISASPRRTRAGSSTSARDRGGAPPP